MFKSIRSRLLLILAIVILFTTLAISILLQNKFNETIVDAQDEDALHLLTSIVLNVENQYESLLFHEKAVLEGRKSEIKKMVEIARSGIFNAYKKYEDGILSEQEAKDMAIDYIQNMRYDNGVGYLWINDVSRPYARMIMHPTRPELNGKILNDPSFYCVKGTNENLFSEFVNVCLKDGQGFVEYQWPKPTYDGLTEKRPKISYVELFYEWNWIIGTGVYLEDMESESVKRINAIKKQMEKTLAQVNIMKSGYIYISDGDYQFVIHPTLKGDTRDHISPVTNESICYDLMDASKNPSVPYIYIWDKPEDPGNFVYVKHAYSKYFEPFDWYITISYYKNDTDMPIKHIRNYMIIISIVFILFSFFVSYIFSKSVTNPINDIVKASTDIASGKFDISLKHSSLKEINILSTSLTSMGDKLKNLTQNLINEKEQLLRSEENFRQFFDDLVTAVNVKNYSKRVNPQSDDDVLAFSMNKILKALHDAEIESKNQNWIKTGQAELSRKIGGEQKLNELCRNAVTYIVKHINAQVGTIYLRDNENEDFYLIASYAFKKRKNFTNRFKLGEGLIGQSALEKEMILFTNVPEEYLKIESALGFVSPRNIVVVPLIYENDVKGVMEIGCVDDFTAIHMDFIKLVCGALAVAINVAAAKEQMNQLYHRTIEQAEELRAQQEELQNINTNLEEQAEELKTSQAKLQEQQEELRASNEELEEKTELLENQKHEIEKKNSVLTESQKEIEEKARMLELATKYKSEFLANMSHELRTPLNSMLLLARMLADNDEENLTEDQVESANSIHNSGQNLLRLINDVLDLSKIEAKKIDLIIAPVKIKEMMKNIELEFKYLAKEKNIEFKVDLKFTEPGTIVTDAHRLQQIVRNLVGNSMKFTKSGSVTVEFAKVPNDNILTSGYAEEEILAIAVSDTGMGIPAEKQQLIFESFTQVDGSISRQYGGTGLGLTISKELAFMLHGKLELTESNAQGTTFSVFIPIKIKDGQKSENNIKNDTVEPSVGKIEIKAEEPKNVAPEDNPAEVNQNTILIIEDDAKFAEILKKFFKKKGYDSVVAGDGETGVKFVMEYKPIAIILDIKLPGINGWTVLDELKSNPKTRHIPVHIMSAHDYGNKGLQKGAIGVLKKPVSIEQLNQALSKLEFVINQEFKELLIVEDDGNLRKGVIKLMQANDIHATSVATGREAVEALEKKSFDCMILDLGLPDISGFELLDKIHSNPKIKRLPIIIYTGKELSKEETDRLGEYSSSIVLKSAASPERLLDETALFMHRVEDQMPEKQQEMIRNVINKEEVLKDKRVLVIDDDMRNAFALNKFLKKKGMDVSIANNGEKALEILRAREIYDIILTDIMMPGMDGYETIREIRKIKDYSKVPIIALTAKAMKTDREDCIRAGANDYLSKPVDVPKLITMMRIWLYHNEENN